MSNFMYPVYDEELLAKSLSEFWATISGRKENSNLMFFADLPFSWKNYIAEQKIYNGLPAKIGLEDDISSLLLRDEVNERLLQRARESGDYELNEFIVRSDTDIKDEEPVDEISVCSISGLLSHELPVKDTFVHSRIVPGFCYGVRRLDSEKPLFDGQALCLEKIGIGYGKRITFAGKVNYFWSDTNPAGFGFSLQLIHVGNKFTILDIYNNSIGTVEVEFLTDPQIETDESIQSDNKCEKQATVALRCKIKYFDDSSFSHNTVHVQGIAISSKKSKSRSNATVLKVKDCYINGQEVTLVPSTLKDIQKAKSTTSQDNVNDVPIVEGLNRNELPVFGTFVDPRITPGFKYKVRLLNSKKHLFEGEALTLLSVGRGYGKRITFAGKSLKENDNYFYSDTNPDGYGFTLEAVSEGNSFEVVDPCGNKIGKASVFKLCGPQIEKKSMVLEKDCVKMVQVSLACHILLDEESDGITTRVNGNAHVLRRRGPSSVQRIDNLEFVNLFNSRNCNLNTVNAFVRK